jgi:CDGSH-type Zn-finger protein
VSNRCPGGSADARRILTARTGYEPNVAEITPYRDGPLLVRGPFTLRDQEGNAIEVVRGTVALCRCGKSRMRPFCDGTHKVVRFRAPSGVENGRDAVT